MNIQTCEKIKIIFMQKFNNCYLCDVICYINLLELIFVLFSPKLGTGSNKISMYLT